MASARKSLTWLVDAVIYNDYDVELGRPAEKEFPDSLLYFNFRAITGDCTMSHKNKNTQRLVNELKAKATPAEKRLFILLKQNNIKFHFQRPFTINRFYRDDAIQKYDAEASERKLYIADFYLPQYAVIVEIDGGVHLGHVAYAKDTKRSEELLKCRSKMIKAIIRFTNDEVFNKSSYVVNTILSLKPVRSTCGIKGEIRQQNKIHNQEIFRKNEIKTIVNLDPDYARM